MNKKARTKSLGNKFGLIRRVGTIALATTVALSVPSVSNVVSKVNPNLQVPVANAQEETENLMIVDDILTNFHINHNDSDNHWTHSFQNDGEMNADGQEFDLTDLKYVVKFPEELSRLLDDEYVLDYLFGRKTNFGSAQNPFSITGIVIDADGEEITIAKDEHKPYEHISINKETNSLEFDFTSFYEANELEPYIRQNVNGEYFFNTLGFTTPIIVPDERILDNGTYEFKSAIVRGESVDLDDVSNAYSENLVVDYSTDPEPEPEPEEPEVDTSNLEALVEEANGYDAEDYTEESFAALTSAVEAAEAILDNEEATQEDVDAVVMTLQNAIDDLVEVEEPEEPEVDTSELEALVEEANGYDAEDYTEESFAALTSAVEAAEAVLDNEEATQAEVDEALSALQTAIADLVEAEEPEPEPEEPEVDTSDLEDLIEEANGYDAEDYTEESFAALTSALEAAESVLDNEEATQEEVDEALSALQTAIADLVEAEEPEPEPEDPEVDTSELETLVEEADGYDAEDYTEESFAALTSAVEAAEAVLANDEATQEDVDAVVATLQNAIDGLIEAEEPEPEPEPEEPEVDTSDLEALVDEANGYDDEDYTGDSFATFTAAFEVAKAVLENEDATQEDVDEALVALQTAIDDLVEAEGNKLPKTATTTFNMILAGFIALTTGGVGLFFARRKTFN